MRIFITGTSGFVGGHIYKDLKSKGYKVDPVLSSTNDAHSKNKIGISEFLSQSSETLLKAEENFVFIHTGWGGVLGADRNSLEQLKNIELTSKLFEKCLRLGCKHFILFGSQAEYAPSSTILKEDSPIGPISLYGYAKNASRELLELQNSLFKSPCKFTHLRLFDVYGPGDNENWVLPMAISKLRKGEQVSLTSGTQIWNFLHISDVSSAVLCLIQQQIGGIFNLCSSENWLLRDYLQQAARYLDAEHLLAFGDASHHSEARSISGSNEKLFRTSGWQPKFLFCEGLKQMLGEAP